MSKKTQNKCEELIERLKELKKAINATEVPKITKPIPTKYTPAQIAAIEEASKLKKNAEKLPWVTHAKVPNADTEVKRVQAVNPAVKGENALANQLANMMAGRAMLGNKPPRQPSNEEMFGHLVPTEDQLKKAEHDWNNRMNWLEEAMKPISSRFKSPEEEEKYWASIKVVDKDDGKPGF
jgi:hypothetical protein